VIAPNDSPAPRRLGRWYRRLPAVLGASIVLAAAAFVLAPTGHLNSRSIVQINGSTYAVPSEVKVAMLAEFSSLLARPGSRFDLTGDVIVPAQGSAAERQMNGAPLTEDAMPSDGALLVARHGEPILEEIRRKTANIPFETILEGKGAIVRLAQEGAPGEQEIYKGVLSGKQAAAFVVTAPRNSVIQRTSTAKAGQKLAALTFDDGPGTYTQQVLDALASRHVLATFFVLGSSAAGNKTMIAKMKAAGHEVENHTWSHPILTEVSAERVRSEISRTNAVIGGSSFLRPPYGEYNAAVAAQAGAMGLKLALWTVDTLDWKYPDANSILSYVKAETKPGAIILMHDGGKNRAQTAAAVPLVVDWLFANGYALTTVANLL